MIADESVPVAEITKVRQQYLAWSGAKTDEIEEARQARHYYHGAQWSEEAARKVKKRGQPVITYNRINRKVDGIVGLLERLRQDPKAYPRTPQHDDGAEIATSVMKYALDQVSWPDIESECVRDAAIEGIAVAELTLETGDRGDVEIGLDIVDPDLFYYDPRSSREDFSDARFMGVSKWLDLEQAQEMYPEQAQALADAVTSGGGIENVSQADRESRWIDSTQKRVRLLEHWYIKNAQWHYCIATGWTVLQEGVSPFIDEKGKSFCKYLAFSAYVDHDGDRYGIVRNLKSPQDEVNARRSKSLHILNSRRMIVPKGEQAEIEKMRKESVRPDGIIEYVGREPPIFDDTAKQLDMQGHAALLEEAKNEIDGFGPNPALVGDTKNQSGRAIALLQQAGLAELGPFLRAYRSWKLRVYRAIWNSVQQFWTDERWIRVTDDDGLAQFIQLNALQLDPYGLPVVTNAVGSLDVDIIMDEGPDTVNTMADVFEMLGSLASAGVPVPPQVVIEMSNLPSSVKKRVVGMIEQASQADPLLERGKEAEVAGKEADVENTQAKTMQTIADTMQKVAQAMNPQANAQAQAY